MTKSPSKRAAKSPPASSVGRVKPSRRKAVTLGDGSLFFEGEQVWVVFGQDYGQKAYVKQYAVGPRKYDREVVRIAAWRGGVAIEYSYGKTTLYAGNCFATEEAANECCRRWAATLAVDRIYDVAGG